MNEGRVKGSAPRVGDLKSPSCSTSSVSSLTTPSRRKLNSNVSPNPAVDSTPQVHGAGQQSLEAESSSPSLQRPLKRRLLTAFDESNDSGRIPKRRRSAARGSVDSAQPDSPASATHSCQSDTDSVQQADQAGRKVAGSSSECIAPSRKLTERQQLAMLLQMTANDNPVPVEDEDEKKYTVPRAPTAAARPVDESVARRVPVRLDRRNERGETPLHVASIRGDAPLVAAMIGRGADVVGKDNAGWTPLHDASSHGHIAVVMELLDAGAPVNAPGFGKDRPLHDAASNGHADVVEMLLQYGADPELCNASGERAVDYATTRGHSSVVQLLVSAVATATVRKDLPADDVAVRTTTPVSAAAVHDARPCSTAAWPGDVLPPSLSPVLSLVRTIVRSAAASCDKVSPAKRAPLQQSQPGTGGGLQQLPLASTCPSTPTPPAAESRITAGAHCSSSSPPPTAVLATSVPASPQFGRSQVGTTACGSSVQSTPKACRTSSHFRTPGSAINSRDSGISVMNSPMSSSGCFSPPVAELTGLPESVCSTPPGHISSVPPAPPRLSAAKKDVQLPAKFQRPRFDMLSLSDHLQGRRTVPAGSSSYPTPSTDELVPSSPAEVDTFVERRNRNDREAAMASLPALPSESPAELEQLWQAIHMERCSLRQRFDLQVNRLVDTFEGNRKRIDSRYSDAVSPPNFCQIELACQTNGGVLTGRDPSLELPEAAAAVESRDAQQEANDMKEKQAVSELRAVHSVEWDGLLGHQCMKWKSLCARLGTDVAMPRSTL